MTVHLKFPDEATFAASMPEGWERRGETAHPLPDGVQAIRIMPHPLTVGDAIALASESSAAHECPAERPDVDACLDALAVGWAPVDRAFGLLRSSLGAWYATSVALRAGEFDLSIALTAAQAYAEAYAALALVALDHGLRLPALPGGAQ